MLQEMRGMELDAQQRKLQRHQTLLFPCSAYFTDWRPSGLQGVPWHWHKEAEVFTVTQGLVRVWVDGRSFVLSAGDGAFFNGNTLHCIRMEGSEAGGVRSLVFDPVLISGGCDTIFHQRYVVPLSHSGLSVQPLFRVEDWQAEVLDCICRAHSCCEAEDFGYELNVRALLSRGWLTLLEHLPAGVEAAPPEDGADTRRIKAMISYLHSNYTQPISVQALADSANICVRECQRCFQHVLHTTPMAYLQQYRIQMACELLRDGERSMLEIGLSVGFSNPSHFSRLFRAQIGCSPSAYRARQLTGIQT